MINEDLYILWDLYNSNKRYIFKKEELLTGIKCGTFDVVNIIVTSDNTIRRRRGSFTISSLYEPGTQVKLLKPLTPAGKPSELSFRPGKILKVACVNEVRQEIILHNYGECAGDMTYDDLSDRVVLKFEEIPVCLEKIHRVKPGRDYKTVRSIRIRIRVLQTLVNNTELEKLKQKYGKIEDCDLSMTIDYDEMKYYIQGDNILELRSKMQRFLVEHKPVMSNIIIPRGTMIKIQGEKILLPELDNYINLQDALEGSKDKFGTISVYDLIAAGNLEVCKDGTLSNKWR